MKAILVIDIADDVAEAYEDFTVDYDLRGTPKEDRTVNESIKYVEDCRLKPMPEKIEESEEPNIKYGISEYAVGRNDCIDEIMGETE